MWGKKHHNLKIYYWETTLFCHYFWGKLHPNLHVLGWLFSFDSQLTMDRFLDELTMKISIIVILLSMSFLNCIFCVVTSKNQLSKFYVEEFITKYQIFCQYFLKKEYSGFLFNEMEILPIRFFGVNSKANLLKVSLNPKSHEISNYKHNSHI